MATKQATPQSTSAENTNGSTSANRANGNGKTAPEKRELTKAERIQKANRLMEEAWDMIYNRKNKEGELS